MLELKLTISKIPDTNDYNLFIDYFPTSSDKDDGLVLESLTPAKLKFKKLKIFEADENYPLKLTRSDIQDLYNQLKQLLEETEEVSNAKTI